MDKVKRILNVFGHIGGNARCGQIGPDTYYGECLESVGAWVFLYVNNNTNNCANNCAQNCGQYARSYGGFRRALFAAQSPITKHIGIVGRIVTGAWVFMPQTYGGCATYCARLCAEYARTMGGFRRALFAAQSPIPKREKCFAELGGALQKIVTAVIKRAKVSESAFTELFCGARKPRDCRGNVYRIFPQAIK